jgi:peptidoglycan hydrolase CwlO-like protein
MMDWMFSPMGTTLVVLIAVTLIGFLVCLVWFSKLLRSQKQLSEQVSLLEQNWLTLQTRVAQQADHIHEIRSGAMGVTKRVQTMDQTLNQLQGQVHELEELDPQTRRYRQAARLVESGASVEELMAECELPRAEAELLLSLRKS